MNSREFGLKKLHILFMGAVVFFAPALASAHEVYVLTQGEIGQGLSAPAFSEVGTMLANLQEFFFWGFIAALLVWIVFFVSISRALEKIFDPFLAKLPRYAPIISRVTIGLSFIAAAYYNALFGPELALPAAFGAASTIARAALALSGVCITFGWYARIAACAGLVFFSVEVFLHGAYMLTYTNYLGELLILLFIGVHKDPPQGLLAKAAKTFKPYAFLVLRVLFGVSLLYASLYAKIIHNGLALEVASLPLAGHAHGIAYYFGFEPHFLVLGAAIIEIMIGLFFVLGIEIRFTALFLLFWLSLSLFYFGESVWPHIVLIGIPAALICYGYDRYSLEGRFFKKGGREPVL